MTKRGWCPPLLAAYSTPSVYVYIQLYFEADKLQMKSRSPNYKFPEIPTARQLSAKKLQPEMEICNRK